MSDDREARQVPVTFRATLERLFELVECAVAESMPTSPVVPTGTERHRNFYAATALRHLEHEIAPVLAEFRAIEYKQGRGHPCPLCPDGEGWFETRDSNDQFQGYTDARRAAATGRDDPRFPEELVLQFSCGHVMAMARPKGRIVPLVLECQPMLPGQTAQMTVRPQSTAVRPIRFAIPDAIAALFAIEDIRVGNRSQFQTTGAIPGGMFAESVTRSPMTFETVQTAMDLTLTIRYIGNDPAGVPFSCVAICRDDHDEQARLAQQNAMAAARRAQAANMSRPRPDDALVMRRGDPRWDNLGLGEPPMLGGREDARPYPPPAIRQDIPGMPTLAQQEQIVSAWQDIVSGRRTVGQPGDLRESKVDVEIVDE